MPSMGRSPSRASVHSITSPARRIVKVTLPQPTSPHPQRWTALLMDEPSGGGINGVLLELGFLQRLRESPLWSRIGWIYGTSAGALTGM